MAAAFMAWKKDRSQTHSKRASAITSSSSSAAPVMMPSSAISWRLRRLPRWKWKPVTWNSTHVRAKLTRRNDGFWHEKPPYPPLHADDESVQILPPVCYGAAMAISPSTSCMLTLVAMMRSLKSRANYSQPVAIYRLRGAKRSAYPFTSKPAQNLTPREPEGNDYGNSIQRAPRREKELALEKWSMLVTFIKGLRRQDSTSEILDIRGRSRDRIDISNATARPWIPGYIITADRRVGTDIRSVFATG